MRRSFFLLVATLALGFLFNGHALAQQEPPTELDKRVEATDFTDPESVYELAVWAMNHKASAKVRRAGRKYMREVLSLDEDHEAARKVLGFVRIGEKWYTAKQAKIARRKLVSVEMKSKGYVLYKNGWIKKTEKSNWTSKWEKNDVDVWMSYEDVMRAKGYTLYKGQWLQMNDDDRKAMERHRKQTGEDVLVVSTKHFRLHTSVPAKFVKQYTDLVEEVYNWYTETWQYPQEQRDQLFGGGIAHIWTFETTQQMQDWITVYSEFYEFDDEDKKMMRDRPSGWLLSGKRLMLLIAEEAKDLENPLLHQLGVLMQSWNIRRGSPAWMREAMGHLTEEVFSGIKFGRVNMSTNSRYAGQGGIAGKEYNTKDGRPQTKGLVKAGDDIPIGELSRIVLNQLNGDNLAQGFSIYEWLYRKDRPKLVKLINNMRTAQGGDQPARVADSIRKATGGSVADFERSWRAYIKRYYK